MMVPPVVAMRGSPLDWEREIGGTGEGVKRWERLGREDKRKRICDAPESGIWGEERETSRVFVLGLLWGKLRGREDHTLLPQCRTVGTVWGLGLNPCLTLIVRPLRRGQWFKGRVGPRGTLGLSRPPPPSPS